MATFDFDSLQNGAEIASFNTGVDTLRFLDPSTPAASIVLSQSSDGADVIVTAVAGPFAGKSVVLADVFGLASLKPENFLIAGGGQVLVGDLLTTAIEDDQANSIAGGNGSDYIAGLGGDDS